MTNSTTHTHDLNLPPNAGPHLTTFLAEAEEPEWSLRESQGLAGGPPAANFMLLLFSPWQRFRPILVLRAMLCFNLYCSVSLPCLFGGSDNLCDKQPIYVLNLALPIFFINRFYDVPTYFQIASQPVSSVSTSREPFLNARWCFTS